MPLPLVHLAVAHGIAQDRSAGAGSALEIAPGLYLGAIAPDAIHMREGSTRDDKRRIHLLESPCDARVRMERLDRAAHDLAGTIDRPLLVGWISHLAGDALWSHYMLEYFWSRQAANQPHESRRRVYYRETDKIEYRMYHQVPWRKEVWADLARAQAESVGDFLVAEEIAAWRDRYLRWHSEIGQEPEEEPAFFTMERTETFIDLAVRCCVSGFRTSFAEALEEILAQYPDGSLVSG